MANKKLGTAASELKLPTKKVKGEKKPKWQGKIGKGKVKAEEAVAAPVAVEPVVGAEMPATELEQTTSTEPEAAETLSAPVSSDEPTAEQSIDESAPAQPAIEPESQPTPDPKPTAKKPKKLKVKADIQPKKMSMMAAALHVLQERKVPMTCPEMIDVIGHGGVVG